jgi:hypothetical protein
MFLQRVEAKAAKQSIKSLTQAAIKALDLLHDALQAGGQGNFAASVNMFTASLGRLVEVEPVPNDKKAPTKKADKTKATKKKIKAAHLHEVREVQLPKTQWGKGHERGIHLLDPTEQELDDARYQADRDQFGTIFIYRDHGEKAAKQRLYLVK